MTLSPGDRFIAEVNKCKTTDTSSVSVNNKTIAIGPVSCDDGTKVSIKYLGKREVPSTIRYGICLSEDVIGSERYKEFIEEVIDLLTAEGVTFAKIEEISHNGIAHASVGENKVIVGPTTANEGDLVPLEMITSDHGKIINEDLRGKNYETRLRILSGQHEELPVSLNEEYTTGVTEFDDDARICYVKDIPIRLPDCNAELGQKLDVEVVGFENDSVIGSITKTYDKVVRIDNPGHWARMQWLRESGFQDSPLLELASEFIGVTADYLPKKTERLKTALIAEAIRLCLAEKSKDSTQSYPRAHVTGIRHWIEHKLSAIMGTTDDTETDWLREVLDDDDGPTLAFQGDIIKLSHGYYAASPTRIITVSDSTATLLSGIPTDFFLDKGLDIELRGLSRVVVNTSESELRNHGITVKSQEEYLGTNTPTYNKDYLISFVTKSEATEWQGDQEWEAYVGERGFGLSWGDDPVEVTIKSNTAVSVWREPIEYGMDEFYLRIADNTGITSISIPSNRHKHFCLLIEAISDSPRTVEILRTPSQDTVQLRCGFSPPQSQFRWLAAIGADWRGFKNNRIQWIIKKTTVESVVRVFERLPVKIVDHR